MVVSFGTSALLLGTPSRKIPEKEDSDLIRIQHACGSHAANDTVVHRSNQSPMLIPLDPISSATTLIIRQLVILIPNNHALLHAIPALGCSIERISPSCACAVVAIRHEQCPVRSEGGSAEASYYRVCTHSLPSPTLKHSCRFVLHPKSYGLIYRYQQTIRTHSPRQTPGLTNPRSFALFVK
jgi:hypothetical protein